VRVRTHVEACVDCAEELRLIRSVLALPVRSVPIDVAAIVARLPKPPSAVEDPSVRSLEAHRQARTLAPRRFSRSVWRMAATIGVVIAGGWSVMMVQRGGIGMPIAPVTDSAALGGIRTASALAADTQIASSVVAASDPESAEAGAAVSFGDVGNYTDEELQRVLDRLEKWDGATSTESVTTAPILPVSGGGMLND